MFFEANRYMPVEGDLANSKDFTVLSGRAQAECKKKSHWLKRISHKGKKVTWPGLCQANTRILRQRGYDQPIQVSTQHIVDI
jgi:hypothetical protein